MIAAIPLTLVSIEQLQAVANLGNDGPEANVDAVQPSDLAAEVLSHLQLISSSPYKNGTKHIVVCPFGTESEHDAGVFVFPDSPIGFDCLHKGCPGHGKKGKDLLAFLGLTERAFIRGPNNVIKPILANAITLLKTDPVWTKVVGFNEFTGRVYCKQPSPWSQAVDEEWADYDDTRTAEYMQHSGILVSSAIVHEAIDAVAHGSPYHPVRDFLNAAEAAWDGKPRVDNWLHVYLGVTDNAYSRAVGKAWLVGAVQRIFVPGSRFDYVLVAIGDQGLQKTTLWRTLAIKEDWFWECGIRLDSKDAEEGLEGVWLVELSELASIRRSENEQVRSFLSKPADRYRKPYARRSQLVKRQNVFCASCNDFDFSTDPTGNRRYWPVVCTSLINLEVIARDCTQLWGEATALFKAGEKPYLSPELEKLANRQQAKHYQSNHLDPFIEEFLQRPIPRNITTGDGTFPLEPYDGSNYERITVRDILLHGIGYDSVTKYGDREEKAVVRYLKHKRWIGPKQTWIRGRGSVKYYLRPQEEIDDRLNHPLGEQEK